MTEIRNIHSSLSPSSPHMDISSAHSPVESPAISVTNPSCPSPVSEYRESQGNMLCGAHCICVHAADADLEEGRCSIPSHPEMETVRQHVCVIHGSGNTAFDQQVSEGSSSHQDQVFNQGSHSEERTFGFRVDNSQCDRPATDSSGSDADVEKGRSLSNIKQVGEEEEGQGGCCRVCQLTVDRSPSAGDIIKLGCACKDDLALAHQHCAETWFKIKGNRTCEICGSIAQNVFADRNRDSAEHEEASQVGPTRAERCWHNQPLCNTLLVCVLLILIASWLFRVTLF